MLEFHRTSGRSATVIGQVNVAMAGAAPFKWEVEDTLGLLDWQDGGTVPLLCTRLHADHVSCVVDSLPDRYGFTTLLLLAGAGLAWVSIRLLRSPPEV